MKFKDSDGNWKELHLEPTGDTLPVGTVVKYNGDTVPTGWKKVADSSYSMNETLTGETWIDGKPIYRKVIVVTITSNDLVTIPHDILDIDMCWLSGNSFLDVGGIRLPLNYYRYGGDNNIYAHVSPSVVAVRAVPNGWKNFNAYIIIEYTKITE